MWRQRRGPGMTEQRGEAVDLGGVEPSFATVGAYGAAHGDPVGLKRADVCQGADGERTGQRDLHAAVVGPLDPCRQLIDAGMIQQAALSFIVGIDEPRAAAAF